MQKLRTHGRFLVAALALAIAFVLSVRFSDRGVQFDLKRSSYAASESTDYDLSSLTILNKVLLRLKDNYVEPERIDPNKMLAYAMDEIQNSIAEVVVEFDRPKDQQPKKMKVIVGQKEKSFEIGKIESLWEMSFRLKEIFAFVQENLPENPDLKYSEVEYAAINGMLSTLDPHSTLLPPKHYEEMQTQTGGKFGGLGIVISVRDGNLTVVSPIQGTPAARKGIKSRDRITRIGEESTVNMSLNEAVNLLRGEPGTDVDVWILRKGWSEPRKFVITRAIIKIDSVTSQALSGKIGYIRIKNFQANTASDTKKHLAKLKDKMGGMQGLVLDLRDNPGGLLDQAIRISDLFLEKGTIVSTVGIGNRLREKKGAREQDTEPKYPIIVLMNAGSASASEIVSGALQNHNRAVVVGDRSFGKGTVQVLYPFQDNSALKLTVAQYLTPGGVSIQSRGIVPDIRLLPVFVEKDRVDMFLSDNVVRESDLATPLENDAVKKSEVKTLDMVRHLEKSPSENEDDEFKDADAFEADFDIRLAERLLKKAGENWERKQMLATVQPELKSTERRETDVIVAELKKVGVDWSPGPAVKDPKLALKLETTPSEPVRAGEKLKVKATVTNQSGATIHQLKAVTKADAGVLDDHEFVFGKLAAGASASWETTIEIPKDFPSRREPVVFELSDGEGEFAQKPTLEIEVVQNDRPAFAFSYEVQDASGDGVLTVGENAKLRVIVSNFGTADSAETQVYLKNLAKQAVYLKRGREKIKTVKAGGTAVAEFEFDVKGAPTDAQKIKLEIDVYDAEYRQFAQKNFAIPFAAEDQKGTDAKGLATVGKSTTKVFTGALAQADVAAIANPKATLPVVGETKDWLRVRITDDHAGWVQKNLVTWDKAGTGDPSGLLKDVMFRAPDVSLSSGEWVTKRKRVTITGDANDDSALKDYFVFVYNRDNSKWNTKKLKYARIAGRKAKLAADVPLFEGMNRIEFRVRDDEGMSTSQSAFIFKR